MANIFWLAALWLCMTMAASANIHLEAIAKLPPGEQYRQLSLMLLVSAGAEAGLTGAMIGVAGEGQATRAFNPDDYTTPLSRIVDQESMLAGAAQLFHFARDNQATIRARLDAIEADNPVLISMVEMGAITVDAIIIRNAIADSVAYADIFQGEQVREQLASYRVHTIYLRNVMEYELFNEELARITDEAILSVGGKLDAYQRMFDDETGSKTFDRHIQAAESIYTRDGKFDKHAGELTDDIIRNWILSESQPNR